MPHHAATNSLTERLATSGCQLHVLPVHGVTGTGGQLHPACQRGKRVLDQGETLTLAARLEARVPGAGELGADLRPRAADDVVRGLPWSVDVLQVVIVAR
jgi:hypothetical protein